MSEYSRNYDGKYVCSYGLHTIENEYFYTVNPKGGYGRDEVLICEKCLLSYPEVKQRLIDCGVIKDVNSTA